MPDDKPKRGNTERIRMNTTEKLDLDRWKKILAVSGQKLSTAVRKVGPALANVKTYLKTRASQLRPKA